ncbi:MAG: hypothetical protein PHI31_12660 [Desulfuromonadaceae bacterium]|nr:hypothetical protein [Desulfuromonadaceae bacterium]
MPRSAAETARILSDLYDENFATDSYEPFRITWPQLRSLGAVPRLDDAYLKDLNTTLSESGHSLLPFDEFFLVVKERDLAHYRMVPDRFLEQYLPDDSKVCEDENSDDDDID